MKKKILATLLAATMVLSMMACGSAKEESISNNTTDEDVATNESKDIEIDESKEKENVVIELIAGEQGDYGKMITMSEGTDMEESFYVYYVPAGAYEIVNNGEYMTQISVYEGFAKNEETGYDEYTDAGDIILLDAGKEALIEITEGWFIEIQEPARVSLTLTDSE